MLIIEAKIVNRRLIRCDDHEIPAKSNDVLLRVYASAEWSDAIVQFKKDEKTYDKALVEGICKIPHECTNNTGTISFTAFTGMLKTVTPASVSVIESNYTDEVENEPSPGALAEAVENVREIEKNITECKNDVINYSAEAKECAIISKAQKEKAELAAEESIKSAAAAATSAANASSSESNAANSAIDAKISKNDAEIFSHQAGTYAEQAASSAAAAATSETNTAASETNAAASAESAATSEANASSSESNAADSAIDAKMAKNDAEIFSSQAGTYAEQAAGSATAAATSETNAAASASAAATSAANAAENAATSAEILSDAAEVVEGASKVNISAEQTATGATVTVTDRNGVETSVHIDTLTAIETWEDVKNAVRLGLGPVLFPVGYEFTTLDSDTGNDIIWVVRAHDHHKAANTKLTHTMTLEMKNVYSLANGTYMGLQFDRTEALYYAEEELAAGTYNFSLLEGYRTEYGGGKTLSFTLANPVPAGGIITFPWGEQNQSTDTKINTYAGNAAAVAIESVDVTESAEGISLGTANGAGMLNYMPRVCCGSNNYAQSAVRQWLNSNVAAGSMWWTPQTKYDYLPVSVLSFNGFMHGLPADFLSVVQTASIPCRTTSVYEINSLDGTEFTINQIYELQDKFFLLSRPEIFGGWDNTSYKDGELLEFYEGLTNTERVKYDAAGSARNCWLRSPVPGDTYGERIVSPSGGWSSGRANYAYGVAAACIIA